MADALTDGGSARSQTIAAEFLGSTDDAGRAERRSDVSFFVFVVVAAASFREVARFSAVKVNNDNVHFKVPPQRTLAW